ncbi:hypothetical protein CN936_09555 [Bacillus cereus]|nr:MULTISPECIES: sporulation delaying protein family toxin [Bacillus cereus group]ANN35629.1 hypothetical protein A9498_30095 [Bacillus thuringiensis serovar coreanensis]KMQ23986.1 hypothetical protein TU58_24315 [Bacillus cereus]PDY02682.1 hypothetical protein COM66_27000 [Bacillus cereus]PFR41710.1 hypothetical protein COK29_32150 [Bacillus cereus]PGL96636.1 hypothetical protein CN936_09555 [Bacillus cereus]
MLKFKNALSMKRVVPILLSFMLMFSFVISPKSQAKTTTPNYTGEEMFLGVFFGQGEVAKLFPEMWNKENLKSANNKESKKFLNDLVAEMKQVDPSYFNKLEQSIKKGDFVAIDNSFDEGAKLMGKSFKNMGVELKSDQLEDGATGRCVAALQVVTQIGYVASYGAVTAVVAAIGAAVVYSAYVYNKTEYWAPQNEDRTTQLEKEQFIGNVVDKLAVN